MSESLEQRVLLCAPFGKDAQLACHVLEGAGLACHTCKSLPELLRELARGAGAVLTVEEALPYYAMVPFRDYLSRQPTWSDLPILVLTKTGGDSPWIKQAYDQLGNVTLLERPVRSPTLISAIRSALRARQRQYEIRTTDRRKDEFLAMLAHELRNPLAPISAAATILGIMSSNPEKVKWSSQIITRQVGHMTNLIDDLLDVARVTRGLITFKKETLDFRDIVTEALEQIDPLLITRQHGLSLSLPKETAAVLGDRKRLVQVMTNLLANACKYTPEGGCIAVELRLTADEVLAEVSDNGIGMLPDVVTHVFDLFTQAERTPDRSQGGLGLGLALVKSLVQAHDGSVQAESKGAGEGSRFVVRLPRISAVEMRDEHRALSSLLPDTNQRLRILIVDDNADAANMLELFLSTAGHEVCVEYTASKALIRAEQLAPQVCVLDIGLPDMDGHALAQQLRAMPQTSNAMLIAVTGYSQDIEKEKSLTAGFNHHFVKPVDALHLANLLSKSADGSSLHA